jgi:regulator of sigma D
MSPDPTSGERAWLRRAITELLRERHEMLAAFCRVAGLEPFSRSERDVALLQGFCQLLMDYLALWHFEIENHLAADADSFTAALREASRRQPVLLEGTDCAVEFNDRYDNRSDAIDVPRLERDLARLAECIAARLEAEDRVLAALPGD